MEPTRDMRDRVAAIARRHGFGADAAEAMLAALARGGGRQAQFDHPALGGMGQWSGGMLMIGDMFNAGLKARVEALIRDLVPLADSVAPAPQVPDGGGGAAPDWPAGLGAPSSSGAQNDMRYAVFPDARRLAVWQGGRMTLYDTGDHRISGVSQQQGGGQTLQFASQHGPVPLDSLTRVGDAAPASPARPVPPPVPPAAGDSPPQDAAGAGKGEGSIPALIEQLHALLSRGILTQAEFDAKKAELLSRI